MVFVVVGISIMSNLTKKDYLAILDSTDYIQYKSPYLNTTCDEYARKIIAFTEEGEYKGYPVIVTYYFKKATSPVLKYVDWRCTIEDILLDSSKFEESEISLEKARQETGLQID